MEYIAHVHAYDIVNAVHCSMLQLGVAVCCSVLQLNAMEYIAPVHAYDIANVQNCVFSDQQCVAVCCS